MSYMDIDERLAKLTERHEALTQTVELVAAMQLENERVSHELSQQVSQLAQGLDQLSQQVSQLAQGLDQLSQRVNQVAQQVDRVANAVGTVAKAVGQVADEVGRFSNDMIVLAQQVKLVVQVVKSHEDRLDRLERP